VQLGRDLNTPGINDTMSARPRQLKINPTPNVDSQRTKTETGEYTAQVVRSSMAFDVQRNSDEAAERRQTAAFIDRLFIATNQFEATLFLASAPARPLNR
jgi:hypothetical protein